MRSPLTPRRPRRSWVPSRVHSCMTGPVVRTGAPEAGPLYARPIVGPMTVYAEPPCPPPCWLTTRAFLDPARAGSAPARAAAIQGVWLLTNPPPGSSLAPISSCERFGHIERHLIAQDVVRRARQLVGYRLDRHDPLGPALLALVEALNRSRVARGEVRRFHKGPGQVPVAVLDVPHSFLLEVAQLRAPDAATVRGEVADRRKAPDRARLQHDGQPQNVPDARDGLELHELRAQLHPLEHDLLERGDLRIQTFPHTHRGSDGQRHIRILHQLGRLLRIEPLEHYALDPTARGALHQVLDADQVRRPLAHQARPRAQQIAHRPLGLGIDVAGRQDPQPQ